MIPPEAPLFSKTWPTGGCRASDSLWRLPHATAFCSQLLIHTSPSSQSPSYSSSSSFTAASQVSVLSSPRLSWTSLNSSLLELQVPELSSRRSHLVFLRRPSARSRLSLPEIYLTDAAAPRETEYCSIAQAQDEEPSALVLDLRLVLALSSSGCRLLRFVLVTQSPRASSYSSCSTQLLAAISCSQCSVSSSHTPQLLRPYYQHLALRHWRDPYPLIGRQPADWIEYPATEVFAW